MGLLRTPPSPGNHFRPPAMTPWRVLARFVLGWPLDGYRHADSTWTEPATKSLLHGGGDPGWWNGLPLRTRALIRLGVLAGAVLECLCLWLAGWRVTVLLDAAAVLAGTWHAGRFTAGWWRGRRHDREVTRPLARSLAGPLGLESRAPSTWVHIPPALLATDDREVFGRIDLPDQVAAETGTRRIVEDAIRHKLPGDLETTFRLSGSTPHVIIRHRPSPPARVSLDDIRAAIDAAPEHELVLGLGAGRTPVRVSLLDDSPHIGVSMASGAGKSATVRAVAAPLYRRGADLAVLDIKRVSHVWAAGLPRVRYARKVEQIHDLLVDLAAEMSRRYDALEADATATFGRIGIIAEECNITAAALSRYWQSIRSKDDQKQSPALVALADLLAAGRLIDDAAGL